MARSPGFYWARLRKASGPEMLHRLREKTFIELLRLRYTTSGCGLQVPEPSPAFLTGLHFPAASTVPDWNVPSDGIVHGLDQVSREKEEERFRKVFFSRISSDQLSCDLRALWEPARLQDITADVFEKSALPREEPDKDVLQRALTWIDRNPFPFGLHYLSVMECALRIPVFARCLAFSRDNEHAQRKLLSAIYHHAWLTAKRLSLHSSLGNHTVTECIGLIFAGAIFGESVAGKKWLNMGVALLEQELPHQILDDGGPCEQSLDYHRFVLDLYWLAANFLEQNDLYDCSTWKARLLTGEAFLAAMSDNNGLFPAIGDSDDGRAVASGLAPRRGLPIRPVVAQKIQTFPQAGYTVLRGPHGSVLTFDHGPLGMAPLYNHGHADALALTLSIKGKQLLVDSGTYRYNQVPDWRQYFKGTRAHNTVTIDGVDQAVQVTGFIWDKPYSAQLISCQNTDAGIRLEASHSGYTRLPQPVEHRRALLWTGDGCILIKDTFLGQGEHTFELNFHFHPEAAISEKDGWWHVCRGNAWLALCLFEENNFTHVYGQESPILGWHSSSYGNKEKTGVLQKRKIGESKTVTFTSALIFAGELCKERISRCANFL